MVAGADTEPVAELSCAETEPVTVAGEEREPLTEASWAVTVPVIVEEDPPHVTLSVATSGSVSE